MGRHSIKFKITLMLTIIISSLSCAAYDIKQYNVRKVLSEWTQETDA